MGEHKKVTGSTRSCICCTVGVNKTVLHISAAIVTKAVVKNITALHLCSWGGSGEEVVNGATFLPSPSREQAERSEGSFAVCLKHQPHQQERRERILLPYHAWKKWEWIWFSWFNYFLAKAMQCFSTVVLSFCSSSTGWFLKVFKYIICHLYIQISSMSSILQL